LRQWSQRIAAVLLSKVARHHMADRDVMKMILKRTMTTRMNMAMEIIHLRVITIMKKTRKITTRIMMMKRRMRTTNSLIPGTRKMRTKRTSMIMTASAEAGIMSMSIQAGEDLLSGAVHRIGTVRAAVAGGLPPWTGTR
jgi:hypothetical protein